MKLQKLVLSVTSILLFTVTSVKAEIWQPGQNHTQIPIWPKGAPNNPKEILAESMTVGDHLKGGKPVTWVWNVSEPTMTVYPAKGANSGAAILVFPGGGHMGLAIDLEGTEVCEWLSEASITCILLKYRVPNSGCHWDAKLKKHVTPKFPMALQDAQRTISIVRSKAKDYAIDPNKIGVMGFSAGGNLAVLSSTAFNKRSYQHVDEIDNISCRPNFAIPVFPGHMTMEHKNKKPKEVAAKELNTDIEISKEVPPTLLVHAKDDPVDPVYFSEVYARELKKAGLIVKLNLYGTGGHGFGKRTQGKDTDRWTNDAFDWLDEIKIRKKN